VRLAQFPLLAVSPYSDTVCSCNPYAKTDVSRIAVLMYSMSTQCRSEHSRLNSGLGTLLKRKISFRTPQEKTASLLQRITAMQFKEIVAVRNDNHMKVTRVRCAVNTQISKDSGVLIKP
jgi:hypothetical protein